MASSCDTVPPPPVISRLMATIGHWIVNVLAAASGTMT
jgi:hypothetical protein